MKFIFAIWLLTFSSISLASNEDNILGKWSCEPYKHYFTETVFFYISVESEYFSDGTSVDTQTWILDGQEDDIWFSIEYRGPWKFTYDLLTETTTKENFVDASDKVKSIPNLDIHQLMGTANADININVSKVLTLTNSSLILEDVDDNEIITCMRPAKMANKQINKD